MPFVRDAAQQFRQVAFISNCEIGREIVLAILRYSSMRVIELLAGPGEGKAECPFAKPNGLFRKT